jgi:LytS/YehU family sensor histidine kinase
VANKELQLKMLSWRLNPSFYFKTIDYLKQVAAVKPAAAAAPILQLSKVMEYVIYDAKETMVPVKKEMIFLENYIRLLNEQPGNNIFFHLTLHEENASFKIVPLLLTGVLDDIKAGNNGTVKEQYDITIHLLQNELRTAIRKQAGGEIVLHAASPAMERITKIYPEAFSLSAGHHHSLIQICIRSNVS